MSVVRKVYDPQLQRHTALKVLSVADGQDRQQAQERFLAEARVIGQLEHPNIVPIHTFGSGEAGDFINMKLVQGSTLSDRVRRLGPDRLRPAALTEGLEILLKVCDAIAYAHAQGIVHRDLKPANIMVGDFGQVYVVDWGIALRLDQPPDDEAGRLMGTPTYIPPEQIDAPHSVDGRADVYSLGGCLYALLTGEAPHQGRTPMLRLLASMNGRIPPPAERVSDPRLPQPLSEIAMVALRQDPAERFPTVLAFKQAILDFLRGSWRLPVRTLAPGQIAVQEGDEGHEAFIIQQGTLRVRSEAQGEIRRLGPGDVFGELAILSGGRRTSTVEALTEARLLVVTRDRLTEGLGLNSWMGVFVRALADRFADLEARLARLSP